LAAAKVERVKQRFGRWLILSDAAVLAENKFLHLVMQPTRFCCTIFKARFFLPARKSGRSLSMPVRQADRSARATKHAITIKTVEEHA
jgi:hypothetical protein